MQMDTLEICLIQVIKALKDYLFLLMIILMESHKPINDLIKQYDEVRKVSTGQSDDYTTGCLLDFAYFLKKLQINCS